MFIVYYGYPSWRGSQTYIYTLWNPRNPLFPSNIHFTILFCHPYGEQDGSLNSAKANISEKLKSTKNNDIFRILHVFCLHWCLMISGLKVCTKTYLASLESLKPPLSNDYKYGDAILPYWRSFRGISTYYKIMIHNALLNSCKCDHFMWISVVDRF